MEIINRRVYGIEDASIATVTENADGTFALSVKNEGETEIIIQGNDFVQSFGFMGKK